MPYVIGLRYWEINGVKMGPQPIWSDEVSKHQSEGAKPMASKFQPPNLENATPEFVLDQMGKLSIAENYAKKLRKYYREWLITKLGLNPEALGTTELQGEDMFNATFSVGDQNRFSQTAFKEAHPDLYEEFKRDLRVATVRFSAKDGKIEPKASAILEELYAELDLGEYVEEP